MADGKRRYKSDRKDYKISVKLSEKDMDILKAALKRTGMTASAAFRISISFSDSFTDIL